MVALHSTFNIKHSTFLVLHLELKAEASTEREISHFVVVIDPVIRELRDESGAPRDREVAVDAARKSVVCFRLISALHFGNREIAQRRALPIETNACEESGRAERFRESVINERIDMLDVSLWNISARACSGGGRELKR